jgi:hypothetical protein
MTGSSKENTDPAWEFYDLKNDPHENHNAYNESEYQDIIKEMKLELQKQREYYGDIDSNYPELQEALENN